MSNPNTTIITTSTWNFIRQHVAVYSKNSINTHAHIYTCACAEATQGHTLVKFILFILQLREKRMGQPAHNDVYIKLKKKNVRILKFVYFITKSPKSSNKMHIVNILQ